VSAQPAVEVAPAVVRRLRRRALADHRWTNVTIAVGALLLGGIVLVSLAGPLLGFGHPNRQNLAAALQAPSWSHPFGTDPLGRDIFTRVLYATRLDLLIVLVGTYVPLLIGALIGAVAGFLGGWTDRIVMRIVDVFIAFPFIVFLIAAVSIFGPGLTGIYVGLLGFNWVIFARLARGEMLVIREQEYVLAAQTLGYSRTRTILRHALPQILRPNLVYSMVTAVLTIAVLASLSYLGLGAQPPTAEWGTIIADGQTYLLTAWWITTLPGLVVVAVGCGFSLLGDGLADRLGVDLRLTT
jgi:peptide/nickel transport system permease protein